MTSQQVSNDEFLARLSQLFEASTSKHSVYVTQKRIARHETALSQAGPSTSAAFPVVVRATDGAASAAKGRTKFSTHVEADKLLAFQDAYTSILRSSLATFLKKRDKAKERKADKQVREKRKAMEEAAAKGAVKVSGIGSKRGAGRRKRQQAVQKAAKMRKERRRQQRATQASTSSSAPVAGKDTKVAA